MANNWTRDQLIIAFNLYCKIPFSKSVQTNPDVIKVAKLVNRSPSAVAFKLGNFGSFDPELKKRGIGGLPNASRLDRQIWDEFNSNWDELAYQSEKLIAKFSETPIEQTSDINLSDVPIGFDREQLVKIRVNQHFFRQSVLSIYGNKCCITGIAIKTLLVASHIVPWRFDVGNRTNPQNGLCLNVLHDKAFDRGLITITPDFKIKLSSHLYQSGNETLIADYFGAYENNEIARPDKFVPEEEFLTYHNERIFLN